MTNKQQYLQLVRDVRSFIQSQIRDVCRKEEPKIVSPSTASVSPSRQEVKKLSEATLSKKSAWELQPMQALESAATFYKKLAPFVSICETQPMVFLILPEENPTHRLFLENVSRAITRTFCPASVVNYSEIHFQSAQGKLFLIPAELLRKKWPGCKPHQSFKTDSFTALPLENLDKYAEDVQCKRTLWNAIQSLFQS